MTTSPQGPRSPRDEIDELLPWFAIGALPAREAKRVADALRNDSEIQRRYTIIREELLETIALNESLPPPSPRAMDRLFEKIDAEPERKIVRRADCSGPASRLMAWIRGLSPTVIAWTGAAAAIVLVVQAALISKLWFATPESRYAVMSEAPGSADGVFLLVRFAPTVSAADLAAFLRARNATIVSGPQPNGFFKIKISDTPLSSSELDRFVAGLQTNPPVILAVLRSR